MARGTEEISLAHGRFCWREAGQGRPLVLLHGWSMTHAVFNELTDLLAENFQLLVPDLPGHGGTDPVEPCSLSSFSQVLASWLNTLGLEQVDLLGWSLGGQVAMQFSFEQAHLVRRLMLISSTPRFCAENSWSAGLPLSELRALRRGLQKNYVKTMGDFFNLQFSGEEITAERRHEILQFAVRPVGLPAPESALKTLDILGQEDLRPSLTDIHCQTLVVHGEQDKIIPWAAGDYLSKNIPQGRLVSLPGIGHAPFLSCPGPLAKLVREFVK